MQPRASLWRIAMDAITSGALLGMAFYAGQLTQRVGQVEQAVVTRGSVQISMEADRRLTVLEERIRSLEAR